MTRPPTNRRVLLLATPGQPTNIIYHALRSAFGDIQVVLEQPVSRRQMMRRRWKRLGARAVIGQTLFVALATPWLRRSARARAAEILREHHLDDGPIAEPIIRVRTVNSEETRQQLRTCAPDVVVVCGTRIIDRDTLRAIDAPFINMHAGITPLYRGVHGGYWALAEGRPDLVGTTIHYIDDGVDTGSIIAQPTFDVTPRDSFATYPLLHLVAGLDALLAAVREILDGRPPERRSRDDLGSQLRYHPTLWHYLSIRRKLGIR